MLEMHSTLLQTEYEGEDQGSDEICRPAHALSASGLVRCALRGREITYARPADALVICAYGLRRLHLVQIFLKFNKCIPYRFNAPKGFCRIGYRMILQFQQAR